MLEGARPVLGEDGYQKLKAAIRTLGYVTELLEKTGNDAGGVARAVVSLEHREDREGAEAGRHRHGREEAQRRQAKHTPKSNGSWAWAQWRRGV